MKKTLFLLGCLVLTACGGGTPEPRLEGERINILGSAQQITPVPQAALTPMRLPQAHVMQDWPQAYGVPTHAPQHAALPERVHRAWTRNIGEIRGHVVNTPIVLGSQLFTVNSNHEVKALDAATGKINWRNRLKLPKGEQADFTAGLAADDQTLFVTAATGLVFALNPQTGDILWQADVAAPLRTAPAVRNGRLFIISHDNRLFVVNTEDGALIWTHTGIAESLALASGATPAVTNNVAVIAYTSGDVYAMTIEDGRNLWQASLSRLTANRSFGTLQGIAAAPVVASNVVYVVTVNGALAAFDLESGQRLWRQNVATSQTPWVAGTAIFVLTDDGQLVALNTADGAIRWISRLNSYIPEKRENTNRYWSGPVLAGGRLMVASSDGYALSMNPETGGKLLAVQLLKNAGVSVPPIVANNTLYFLTDNGNVVAFR